MANYQIGMVLPDGAVLKTLDGECVEKLKTISLSGGQGDVYLVRWNGRDYALKWYNRTKIDCVGSAQHKTIVRLTNSPNPDPKRFIWPMKIVTETGREEKGSLFGYLMDLIPDGYYELKEFLRSESDPKRQTFKSYHAMIWCGMHMITAIHALHLRGMSYKDLNPGNIAINPTTGHALMVDCDNISVDGEECTVSGMHGYMAPEIVRSGGRRMPDIQSDQYSEAIILFRMFYMDHPMEGRLWGKVDLHNDKVEDYFYSIKPIYCMARKDDSNRPDKVWAPNVISRMEMLPKVLQEGFETTFVNGIDHIMGRTTENAWLNYLTAARDQIVFLDREGKRDMCVRLDDPTRIPPHCLRLVVGKKRAELALYPMQSLFKNTLTGDHRDYEQRVGYCIAHNGQLAMQNLSGETWLVYDPVSRKKLQVSHQQWFYLKPGMQILFSEKPNQIVGFVDDPRNQ